ncbi:MAG: iron-containing alcohol dehydrogenase [Pseudomonadota bacterium]
MPQFMRVIVHEVLVLVMKTIAALQPGATYRAFVGSGSSGSLCQHIANTGVRKVLVVTDKPLRDLGVVDQAIGALADNGVDVAFYDGVLPDPTYVQVSEGVAVQKAHGSEAVLAIGGGSSIDAAKIIAAAATSDANPQDWVGFGKVKHDVLPLYAIPTTSGTGSEVTMGAVISDNETHEKGVISGANLLPAAAALDADLILGLPPHITAATGIDALTHAIEAYISVWDRGSRKSDSRMAVKLIFDHLVTAYNDGGNRVAREAVALGAYYGGMAINQVNVGNVHAIAHQLGGKYGIPHGLANALVLPGVLEFCRAEAQQDLAELAQLVGVGEQGDSEAALAQAFIQAVRDLREAVGVSPTSDKVQESDYDYLIDLALAEGLQYPTPKVMDKQDVRTILDGIRA